MHFISILPPRVGYKEKKNPAPVFHHLTRLIKCLGDHFDERIAWIEAWITHEHRGNPSQKNRSKHNKQTYNDEENPSQTVYHISDMNDAVLRIDVLLFQELINLFFVVAWHFSLLPLASIWQIL